MEGFLFLFIFMGQIFGVGAPGKIRPSGTIYVDTRTGLSYKQDMVPRGNNWTLIDNNVSDDSNSGTTLTYAKVYSKYYVIDAFTLSTFFSSPISLETLTTEDGNPGAFVFLSCQSKFNYNGDVAGFDPNSAIISISDGTHVIYKNSSFILEELNPRGVLSSVWLKNDIYDNNFSFPPGATIGTPGLKSSIDLKLSGTEDLTLAGFGVCTLTIYLTYTIIQ